MPHPMPVLDRPSLRLFVEAPLSAGADLTLCPEHSHYLSTVMRAQPGQAVALFNGQDGEWRAVIASLGKRAAVLTIESQLRPQAAESLSDLWLLFAPVKKTGTDMIVEKATELGASLLWPINTQFTNAARVNLDRLHANAREAAEQCERLSVPKVREPATLAQALATWETPRILFVLDETGGGAPITDVLSTSGSGPAAFLVGPEGGFSKSELDQLRRSTFVTHINLGPRILRAETAAVAGLTCWQALCGDWRQRPAFRTPYHAPA